MSNVVRMPEHVFEGKKVRIEYVKTVLKRDHLRHDLALFKLKMAYEWKRRARVQKLNQLKNRLLAAKQAAETKEEERKSQAWYDAGTVICWVWLGFLFLIVVLSLLL